jgi:hypothetical protein
MTAIEKGLSDFRVEVALGLTEVKNEASSQMNGMADWKTQMSFAEKSMSDLKKEVAELQGGLSVMSNDVKMER